MYRYKIDPIGAHSGHWSKMQITEMTEESKRTCKNPSKSSSFCSTAASRSDIRSSKLSRAATVVWRNSACFTLRNADRVTKQVEVNTAQHGAKEHDAGWKLLHEGETQRKVQSDELVTITNALRTSGQMCGRCGQPKVHKPSIDNPSADAPWVNLVIYLQKVMSMALKQRPDAFRAPVKLATDLSLVCQ